MAESAITVAHATTMKEVTAESAITSQQVMEPPVHHLLSLSNTSQQVIEPPVSFIVVACATSLP